MQLVIGIFVSSAVGALLIYNVMVSLRLLRQPHWDRKGFHLAFIWLVPLIGAFAVREALLPFPDRKRATEELGADDLEDAPPMGDAFDSVGGVGDAGTAD